MTELIGNKKGIALITTYIVIAVLLTFSTIYIMRSFYEFRFSQRQKDTQRAHYIAEAGLNEVIMGIYQAYKQQGGTFPGWFLNLNANYGTYIGQSSGFPNVRTIDNAQCNVILAANSPIVVLPDGKSVIVKLISVGMINFQGGTVRKVIAANVYYAIEALEVFNNAFFVNNSCDFPGGGGTGINGNFCSNGDISFSGSPTINGDIYAAGAITGGSSNWNLSEYMSKAGNRAPPANPANYPNLPAIEYQNGYNGTSTRSQNQMAVEMPTLGDLDTYRQSAYANNGTIKKDGVTLVDAVYNGSGPDDNSGTPDDGCIILEGSASKPIVINGPVVVERDLIIKGVISGSGTIYTGRNIHIADNITYKYPPSWPKPDNDPSATAEMNKSKDFVGLLARGNVVIGDYTDGAFKAQVLPELSLQPYEVDSGDAEIGYDSDNDPSNGYWFDGNYNANDGGQKNDLTNRKYYESSLSDSDWKSVAQKNISTINGIIYTNHVVAVKGGFTLNGALICRNQTIFSTAGNLKLNYDERANNENALANINIYLPSDIGLPKKRAIQRD